MPIFDLEIFRMIKKTHSFGNPEKEEWLLKLADREASERQRVVSFPRQDSNIIQEIVKKIVEKQFMKHFEKHGANTEKLRKFVQENQWLDSILADTSDMQNSSLREHLLLTEQILSILLELREEHPFNKNLISWFNTKKIQQQLETRIKSIGKSKGRRLNIELLERMIDLIERKKSINITDLFRELSDFPKSSVSKKLKLIRSTGVISVKNNNISFKSKEPKNQNFGFDIEFLEIWNEERIALELGITVSEAFEVKNNMKNLND